jgi:hypothetical protein
MFSNSNSNNHVLTIEEYSQEDIFLLFDLPPSAKKEIRLEHVKLAKQKVVQSHPDKSRLHPDYFRFYKKAFERLVEIYENQTKTEQRVPTVSCKDDEMQYHPIDSTISSVGNTSLSSKEFQSVFNRLFDENMAERQDPKKNEWFRSEEIDPVYANMTSVQNTTQMNAEMERIKMQEKQRALAVYRGVMPLSSNGQGAFGTNYLGETEEERGEYIMSDPFSKLKYDDLRKVHKDQTVFMVSEKDLDNVPKYGSVDAYKTERTQNQHQWKPVEKAEGERVLSEQEQIRREIMMRKAESARIQENVYAEKNRKVMSAFLQLR